VGHAALTMAEYFRDDEHRDVLLLIDNIFRFIQAGIGSVRPDGADAVAAGLSAHDGHRAVALEERIANTDTGAITSIQAVYVPADDFTDPAAVHTFSHLSASIVLSRKRASEGFIPAIDPLQSSSKMATPGIVGERHYAWRRKSGARSRNTRNSRTSSPCSAWSSFRRRTATWSPAPAGWSVFSPSPFSPPSSSPASKESSSASKDALDGCERILRDEFKDYPESALYMIGTIDERRKGQAPRPSDSS
jgi:F-type H+/Na+-transporting ATPase subunit beta